MACPAVTPVPTGASAPEPVLSPLETMMLAALAEGLSLEAVARRAGMSARTLRRHMRALCDRLGARSPTQAVAWAARRGLV
jgi:DNA-binding CsgD family transcriptional regulator